MIRTLGLTDDELIHSYLDIKPMYSLFFTADIADYGFDSSFFKLYGSFENNNLNCIFARFYQVLLIYSNSNTIPVKEILDYLEDNVINFTIVRGEASLVNQFNDYIDFSITHKTQLCKLFKNKFNPIIDNSLKITKADASYTEQIIGLCNSITEFKGLMNEESVCKFIDYGYTYLILEDNTVASMIMCSAKNKQIANIGTVATLPSYRKKGYATTLLSYLCTELFKVSDSCSLCYDNPTAGSIYKNIGFEEIGFIGLYIK